MPVFRVSDPADDALADYRGLTDVALRRVIEPERGLYMAEGAKVIARAVAAGHRPRSVLLSERWLTSLPDDVPPDVPVYVADEATLEQITGYQVHRGALAAMHRPQLPSVRALIAGTRRVVVLESIVDHTNVGAIFRSAAALGADAIIVAPTCADPLYRRSVKVSMGSVFQVPWTRAHEWPGALDVLRQEGFTVAALALSDEAVALDDFAGPLGADAKVALVMGAEGDGLSRGAIASSDLVVTIPMAGGVDSLNVAAASAVAMWALR